MRVTDPPIIQVVPTLALAHKVQKQLQRHPDEEVSSLVRSVLSIIVFNLNNPVAIVTREQRNIVDRLEAVANGV